MTIAQNINQALEKTKTTPLFFGINHAHHWPLDAQPGIVIDNCQAIKKFLNQHPKPENLTFIDTFFHPYIDEASILIELASLSFRLCRLEHAWHKSYQIFFETNDSLNEQLINCVKKTQTALSFHGTKADIYQSLKASPKEQKLGIFYEDDTHRQLLRRSLSINEWENAVFFKVTLGSAQAENTYQAESNRFITWLESELPTQVVWLNNSFFSNLDRIFYFWEVLRLSDYAVKALFLDYFYHQSLHYSGGIYFHLLCDLLPLKNAIFSSIYEYDVNIDPPKATLQTHSFHFINPDFSKRSALINNNQIVRDIAVIHHTRLNCIKQHEINECYELATTMPEHRQECVAVSILNHLYFLTDKMHIPAHPHAIKHFIRFMHFNFYAQIKIRLALSLLPELSKKWRVTTYGEDWDQIFGSQIHTEKAVYGDKLQDVYASSLITLDLTPEFTAHTPNLNSFDCIQSGGVPLKLEPFLNKPVSFNFEIPRYKTLDDIQSHLLQLSDLKYRANLNQNLQSQAIFWHENNKHISQLKLNSVLSDDLQPITPSEFIQTAAPGYLFFLMGFYEQAFQSWDQALRLKFHHPLVERFIKTGIALKKHKTCLDVLAPYQFEIRTMPKLESLYNILTARID